MGFFEAKDWTDKVPGWAWVVAIGVVTSVVVAVGVALVAGGLWLTGSAGSRNGNKPSAPCIWSFVFIQVSSV